MDGQNARHMVSDVVSVAHGLTLDPIRGRFYWIEPQQVPFASIIQTAKLDGTDRCVCVLMAFLCVGGYGGCGCVCVCMFVCVGGVMCVVCMHEYR